jgi:RAB protein geranylgeranyltransferase component A
MKFLKFVLDFESEAQVATWKPVADSPLTDFLASEFKLDTTLQSHIITLTLSLDGKVSVEAGLRAISRHLQSMGTFGIGFAAVYPKWGGLSEVAQVGCRAAAVGGAVYMLGSGIDRFSPAESSSAGELELVLTDQTVVKTKSLYQGSENLAVGASQVSRLTVVVNSPLTALFEPTVQGAPTPAVAVVSFPVGSVLTDDGTASEYPIYSMLHSSDTGECPVGQCTLYLSTIPTERSKHLLQRALAALLATQKVEHADACLYQLYYEQRAGSGELKVDGNVVTFPCPSISLAFDDATLEPVRQAWDTVGRPDGAEGVTYMQFEDREKLDDDDDVYE